MAASLRTAIDEARASAVPSGAALPGARVVFALSRIEAKHLVRHPSLLVSIAFGLLLFRGGIGIGGAGGAMMNLAWLAGGVAIGMLVGAVLSSNVAALRARRDHLTELYGSMPSPVEARTAGLVAGLVLGLGGASIVVGGLTWLALTQVHDIEPYVDLFLFSQYPLSIVALGAIGVAVGRWVPSVLGGPLVVVAHVFTGVIWIVPWIAHSGSNIHVAWHLTYLVAVIVAFAALAFARDRRTLARFAVSAAAFGLAVVAAVQQMPPGGFA